MVDIASLNDKYQFLSPQMRLEKLFEENDPDQILVTSSFGTSSVILLHLISKVRPDHPVYFIDTGYHFKETLEFKDQLVSQLGLNVKTLQSPKNRFGFTQKHKTYRYNQDLCCHVNKVMPVDNIKPGHEFWLSGLLRFQNANRARLQVFENKNDMVKMHAILDMTEKEVELYKYINELPDHPLIGRGYNSVGCTHCTERGIGRAGRWADSAKVECGLHA